MRRPRRRRLKTPSLTLLNRGAGVRLSTRERSDAFLPKRIDRKGKMGSGQLYKVFGQEQVRSSRKNFFKGQGKLLQKPQADVAAPGPAGAPDQDWHRDFLQVGGTARFQGGPNRSKKSGR